MTRIQLAIGAAVLAAAMCFVALERRGTERHVVRGGFWFDHVTFQIPPPTAALVAPITGPERQTIESLAWSELRSAYAGLRITFVDSPDVRRAKSDGDRASARVPLIR